MHCSLNVRYPRTKTLSLDTINFLLISGILFLALVFSLLYTANVALGVLLVYFVGLVFTTVFSKKKIVLIIFNMFFLIYGIYLLVTQIVFVSNNLDDYFFHIDASKSFYYQTILYIDTINWSNLIPVSILIYPDYPFAQILFSGWWLIGDALGVHYDDMRLFLRIQDLFFSPLILCIIARFLCEIKYDDKRIINLTLLFGLFSYLLITSVIFTRDLHVAFLYTLLGYYTISKTNHRHRYLIFSVLIFLSFGFRIENGIFAFLFPICYYYTKHKFGGASYLLISVILTCVLVSGLIPMVLELRDGFNEHTVALNNGGLYNYLNSLPFPLNTSFNAIYSFMFPFPFIQYIQDDHGGILTVTSIISPFLRVIMLYTLIRYSIIQNNRWVKLVLYVIFLYIISCSLVEPNLRRLFAVLPTMFMLFSYCFFRLRKEMRHRIIVNSILIVVCLNIPAIMLLMFNS